MVLMFCRVCEAVGHARCRRGWQRLTPHAGDLFPLSPTARAYKLVLSGYRDFLAWLES
jgi:hypothetical protein